MSNKNLTKTLFADFRKVDTKKLNINGNPFSKVMSANIPETPTENDLWKYAVTTDENGVVTITDDVTVDFSEITTAQRDITKTAVKVIDNEVLDANGAVLMNWDTKNFTNENSRNINIFGGGFQKKAPITEWDSDLSSLKSGKSMFTNTSLKSFNGDLSSLTDGNMMFTDTSITEWNSDLPSLTNGYMMFYVCMSLTSFTVDLPSLTNGSNMLGGTSITEWNSDLQSLVKGDKMFYKSALESFSGDLSSLENGNRMFYGTALESFSGDLSSLTDGGGMFRKTTLESFNGDLSSLTDGSYMFCGTALTSFSGDLSSLTDGSYMFQSSALESFSGDLSSLTNGYRMFRYTQPRQYGVSYWKIVDGSSTQVTETFVSNGLKSFISNLSSLENGYHMFGSGDKIYYQYTDDSGSEVIDITNDVAPLDEESIMLIAETIKDINGLGLTGQNGQLWLGYDATTITDTSKIMKYCDQIAAKGWTVYLNGSLQTANNGVIETISLTNEDGSAIPYYYKPVQVTDEDIAEYVDANNNYYIIVGGQYVFGDDISTYGMFTSYEHAVQEITAGLGLTKYEKPSTETTNN